MKKRDKITRRDIGKEVIYKPETRHGILTDLKGTIAKVRYRGQNGSYYAATWVGNLKLC